MSMEGERVAEDHFRHAQGLTISSIGLGMRSGASNEDTNRRYQQAVIEAAERGCNLFDTGPDYREGESERVLGRAIKEVMKETTFPPPVICTRGTVREPKLGELLVRQLDRSRQELQLDCIDIYYLAGLESIDEIQRSNQLPTTFEWLEKARGDGVIRFYGISSSTAFVQDPRDGDYLSLERIVGVARRVAGSDHGLRFVQAPYSVSRPAVMTGRHQRVRGKSHSLIEATQKLELSFIAAQALGGGDALDEVHPWLSGVMTDSATLPQRMIQFVRSTPGVTSALVGMAHPDHVISNLKLAQVPPVTEDAFEKLVPPTTPQLPWLYSEP